MKVSTFVPFEVKCQLKLIDNGDHELVKIKLPVSLWKENASVKM